MLVTNRDIFEGRNALQELLRCKMPVKNSYQVAQMSRKFNEALGDIDTVRRTLIEKYGTVDKRGGKQVEENNENYDKFMAEFGELLDLEITIVVSKIRIPDLISATCDKCEHDMSRKFEIEPWILSALYKFVEVP